MTGGLTVKKKKKSQSSDFHLILSKVTGSNKNPPCWVPSRKLPRVFNILVKLRIRADGLCFITKHYALKQKTGYWILNNVLFPQSRNFWNPENLIRVIKYFQNLHKATESIHNSWFKIQEECSGKKGGRMQKDYRDS